MAMQPNLNRPPAPDWWEQQEFQLTRRENQLAGEELWLQREQTVEFPARESKRLADYQLQEDALSRQSEDRLRRALLPNILWVVFKGVGRPALTPMQERQNLDREISALKRTFHTLHERDAQFLERQASFLRLKRSQLESDKQTLRDLAAQFGVTLTAI